MVLCHRVEGNSASWELVCYIKTKHSLFVNNLQRTQKLKCTTFTLFSQYENNLKTIQEHRHKNNFQNY